VAALLGGVVYQLPTVITVKVSARDVAACEALGAVRVRSARERVHRWTVVGSGGLWRGPGGSVDKSPEKTRGRRLPAVVLMMRRVPRLRLPGSLIRRKNLLSKRGTSWGTQKTVTATFQSG